MNFDEVFIDKNQKILIQLINGQFVVKSSALDNDNFIEIASGDFDFLKIIKVNSG